MSTNKQIRIPTSKIKKGLYTSGEEYVYPRSTKFYKGYYYTINNKSYVGKDFDINTKQQEIVLAKKIKAINNPNSFIYNIVAGIKQGTSTPIPSKPSKSSALSSIAAANQQGLNPNIGVNPNIDIQPIETQSATQAAESIIATNKRYFFRVLIRPFPKPLYKFGESKTQEELDNLSQKPNYVTATVTETVVPNQKPEFDDKELNAAEKKMPGLKQFLRIEE
jgi:hypothetical protein